MKTAHVVLLILTACIAGSFCYPAKLVWEFGHLEQRAHNSITGTELQAWATNLLAHYTNDTDLTVSGLGTNFPQQLAVLAPRMGPAPDIYVRVLGTDESFVQISWGGGMSGAAGFYVGSTNFAYKGMDNFTDYTNQSYEAYFHVWQPGVWFYRDYGR